MGGPSENPFKRVVGEVHHRSLWQVLSVYVVASWVALQVVDVLVDNFGLPEWFPAFAVALLVVGLPIVLATAFLREGGPTRTSVDEARELDEIFSGDEPAVPSEGDGIQGFFTWKNALTGGVVAFALWGVMAAGWMIVRGAPPEQDGTSLIATDDTRTTVAVLPFENLSASEENAYFADGIHEDILTQLSKVRNLVVLARTSVLRYRDTEKDVSTIADELEADAVLEGSVRRAGDEIRISAQLIDPTTGGHTWADTYDRRMDDVFAVQSDIAQRVAEALEATLSPRVEERIRTAPTNNLQAYDFYLKGRRAYQRYEDEQNDEAIRLFRRAQELDPDYALAWAGLADAMAQRTGRFGYAREWADSAVQAAARSIEIDPELAEGHKSLGLAYQNKGQIRDALDAYLRALELDPSHFSAANNAGILYQNLGRFDEAVRAQRRAARLAPANSFPRVNLAYTYMFLGMTDAAKEAVEATLVLDPGLVTARILSAALAVYRGDVSAALTPAERIVNDAPDQPISWTSAAGVAYMAREFDRAIEYAQRSLRLAPDNELQYWHFTETLLGLSLVASGAPTDGRSVLRGVIERQEDKIEEGDDAYHTRWDLAAAHAALGDGDAALTWLERAYDAGFRFVRWLKVDPAFDGLRDEPRFERIVVDVEAEVAEMRERVREERQVAKLR